MAEVPKQNKGWMVRGASGIDTLVWEDLPLPEPTANDVLVKIHAASLNYRDLMVVKGLYKFGMRDNVVPGSDGAGEVVAVGPRVTRFAPGDKVVTVLHQKDATGSKRARTVNTGLGGMQDGTLRQFGVFNEEGLIDMPDNLTFQEAATLPCAALTAWNSLYGLIPLRAGDAVLAMGTGGVSTFVVQFAAAAGATVIATTSSASKGEILKKLGAHHVIDYKQDPKWGATAKALARDGAGVDVVVDVGGAATLGQSLEAVRKGGQVVMVGYLGGEVEGEPVLMDAFRRLCIARGVAVGSRSQFADMNSAIESNAIKPVIDNKLFKLEDVKDAFEYMQKAMHVGKIVITMEE